MDSGEGIYESLVREIKEETKEEPKKEKLQLWRFKNRLYDCNSREKHKRVSSISKGFYS